MKPTRGGLLSALGVALLLVCAPAAYGSVRADFNGDGRSDLAIHATWEVVGSQRGAVHVLYGSQRGLTTRGDRLFGEDTPRLNGGGQSGDGTFGWALATGKFNADRYADLAIGVLDKTVPPYYRAGAVHVIYGSAQGLTLRDDQYLTEDTPGMVGNGALHSREFGAALAAADFDRDGLDDLAIGAPGWAAHQDAQTVGAIRVLYGGRRHLSLRRDQFVSPLVSDIDVPPAPYYSDFGASLAAGDMNGDGRADLAIGIPRRSAIVNRSVVVYAGAVHILFAARHHITLRGNRLLNEEARGMAGDGPAFDDRFGSSLAIGRLNGDRRGDLAIGVPGHCRGQDFCNGGDGAVHVLYGERRGPSLRGDHNLTEAKPGLRGYESPRADAGFGSALAIANFSGDRPRDLAIGSPGKLVPGFHGAGAVNVLYGAKRRLTLKGDQLFTDATPGFSGDAAREGDALGYALGSGDFNGDRLADLAIGEPQPYFDCDRDECICPTTGSGGIHVLRGGRTHLRLSGDRFLTPTMPGIVGSPSPCDRFGTTLSGGAR